MGSRARDKRRLGKRSRRQVNSGITAGGAASGKNNRGNIINGGQSGMNNNNRGNIINERHKCRLESLPSELSPLPAESPLPAVEAVESPPAQETLDAIASMKSNWACKRGGLQPKR